MIDTVKSGQLQAALVSLASLGVVPGVARNLRADSSRILGEIYELILREVPAYSGSANPDVLPELKQHLRQHIEETCRLLGGARSVELDFVRSHAHRRAEQKFPLDALLNAYRCIHKVFLRRIRDDALGAASESAHVRRVVAAVTEFTIEYTGAIGTLGTSEYVSQTRVLAEAEGDRRTELLNMLLSGYDESDNRAAQLLRRSGYLEQRQSFCVAVARSVDPREMENAARAQRMADALAHAMRNTPVRTLITVRDGLVVAVLSATRRQSGWTAPQSLLAERIYLPLRTLGPAALIGLSSDAPSTSHIPRALQEARIALDFAHAAERVMPHSRIPFAQMLVRAARDNGQSVIPAWLDGFTSADKKSRGALLKTLRCYADNNMNVLQTAKMLSLHPNTIYARMQKIDDITGKNALGYHALTELLLAAELTD